MATEGWATYAASLLATPRPGHPGGAYTPEELFYLRQGDLLVAAGLVADASLHTGRMSFAAAEAWLGQTTEFDGAVESWTADTRETHQSQIYRYSKWPTQALSYGLGRRRIESLRDRLEGRLGAAFSLRHFHEAVLSVGTIPVERAAEIIATALLAAR
jgi:uncharacterized protein (DUF885 family)